MMPLFFLAGLQPGHMEYHKLQAEFHCYSLQGRSKYYFRLHVKVRETQGKREIKVWELEEGLGSTTCSFIWSLLPAESLSLNALSCSCSLLLITVPVSPLTVRRQPSNWCRGKDFPTSSAMQNVSKACSKTSSCSYHCASRCSCSGLPPFLLLQDFFTLSNCFMDKYPVKPAVICSDKESSASYPPVCQTAFKRTGVLPKQEDWQPC